MGGSSGTPPVCSAACVDPSPERVDPSPERVDPSAERVEKMLVAERSHLRGPETGSPIGIIGIATGDGPCAGRGGGSSPTLPPSTCAAARAESSGHSFAAGTKRRRMSSVLPS